MAMDQTNRPDRALAPTLTAEAWHSSPPRLRTRRHPSLSSGQSRHRDKMKTAPNRPAEPVSPNRAGSP